MDSTAPMEESDREYEREMEFLKRRIASKDSDRMFLWSLMRAAAKRDEGWESAANELADALENPLSHVPWYVPRELDARRAATELVKFFWPFFMEWREGFVDQSEFHILVRSGGTELTKDEPPGIDIAVIGPGEFGQLVVEFLPMFGVDPDAARDAEANARGLLTRTVGRGRGDAWSYAQHHCGTGANMYSRVRFVPQGGREP